MEFPTLSHKERDRRWSRLRAYMERSGLDSLIIFGLKGREHYEGYVANEHIEGIAIFPLASDPVLVAWHPKLFMRRLGSKNEQSKFWIKQTRAGLYSEEVSAVLRERGLQHGRIGVVGLGTPEVANPEGLVSHKTWTNILAECPGATFEDVTWDYRELALEKSPEEIEIMRHCGQIGERATLAMIEACKPGASEIDVYCAIKHEIFAAGASVHDPFLIMTWGRDDLGWSEPAWTYSGGPPRRLEPGDLVCAEIFPVYAGLETQQQIAVALAPVEPEILGLAETVRKSYDAGIRALVAGNTFAQLEAAMLEPVLAADCWTFTPLLHSISPLAWVGGMAKNLDRVPDSVKPYRHEMDIKMPNRDLVLKEGMSFAFEPNACRGQRRVNIGGSLLVGSTTPIELNSAANRLHVID